MAQSSDGVRVARATDEFSDWPRLLALLKAAFASQERRIDPPSSVYALDVSSLAAKAHEEYLFLGYSDSELAGCVFAADRQSALYVSKFAVWPHLQGSGIGRRLMSAVEEFARQNGQAILELNTRIELTENHSTLERLGFIKTAEHAHEGFDRPTYITMQKRLGA
jgi:GNAT superfamily N-acetyltransferase